MTSRVCAPVARTERALASSVTATVSFPLPASNQAPPNEAPAASRAVLWSAVADFSAVSRASAWLFVSPRSFCIAARRPAEAGASVAVVEGSAADAWVRPTVAQVPMMSSADRPVRTIVFGLKGVAPSVVPTCGGGTGSGREHLRALSGCAVTGL
ncbi:hypothetical protein GCM10020227_04500 [Streptomyces flavovirens]